VGGEHGGRKLVSAAPCVCIAGVAQSLAEWNDATPPVSAGAIATPEAWEGQRAQAKPSTLGVGIKAAS